MGLPCGVSRICFLAAAAAGEEFCKQNSILYCDDQAYSGKNMSFLFYHKEVHSIMKETRIALIGIIIEEEKGITPANQLLHEYRDYIVGRMGIPYRAKDINIISIVLDAPETAISTLSGRLGMIDGISVKSMFAKTK